MAVDPNDFIIVRKRKKYKFAKFANANNCYELDEWNGGAVDVVELGAGTALFLVELASRYPERSFAAVDVKADRLQKGAHEAIQRNIDNIVFIRARADQINELFPKNSLDQLWLTFSDPFPRERSVRRRMTHPLYLNLYTKLLKKNGELYIKHDAPAFFSWSLEQLVAQHWNITQLSFDVHESDFSEDAKIQTSYEQRWREEGRTVHAVVATPPASIE